MLTTSTTQSTQHPHDWKDVTSIIEGMHCWKCAEVPVYHQPVVRDSDSSGSGSSNLSGFSTTSTEGAQQREWYRYLVVGDQELKASKLITEDPTLYAIKQDIYEMLSDWVVSSNEWESETASPSIQSSSLPSEIESELIDFAAGVEDEVAPSSQVVATARRLSQVAVDNTVEPEISVDVDGALSFDLRLKDNRLVLAELNVDGSISVRMYDPEYEPLASVPSATEQALVDILHS